MSKIMWKNRGAKAIRQGGPFSFSHVSSKGHFLEGKANGGRKERAKARKEEQRSKSWLCAKSAFPKRQLDFLGSSFF